MTIHDLFLQNVEKNSEHIAIEYIDSDKFITRKELYDYASNLAKCLTALGMKKSDRVALHLHNSLELIYSQLACSFAGFPFYNIPPGATETEIDWQLFHAQPKIVITYKPFMFKDFENIITAAQVGEFINTQSETKIDYPIDSDAQFLGLTSGTTSKAKVTVSDHKLRLLHAQVHIEKLKITENDRVYCSGSFSTGPGVSTSRHVFASGATLIFTKKFQESTIKDVIEKARPSYVWINPARITMMYNNGALEEIDFSSVRCLVAGGSKPSYEAVKKLDTLLVNGSYVHVWSMTESGLCMMCDIDDPLEKRLNTVGKPYRSDMIRISKKGELELSPGIFASYINSPEDNKKRTTTDGWFKTGDLVKIDSDGYITITGRIKDLIAFGAMDINPVEIEGIFESHPNVEKTVLISIPDKYSNTEQPYCFVKKVAGTMLSRVDLASHVGNVIPIPLPMEIMDELPTLDNGKIDRKALQDRAKEHFGEKDD